MSNAFGTADESHPYSSNTTSLMTGVLSAKSHLGAELGGDAPVDDLAKNRNVKEDMGNSNKNSKPKIDFLQDDVKYMTYGRRIALALIDKPWYNPIKDDDCYNGDEAQNTSTIERDVDDFDNDIAFEKPDLAKGWAFFEHQSLYRFLLPEGYEKKEKKNICTRIFRTLFMHRNKKFNKAEPGEDDDPSRLYPFFTPHNQLGDFGLGIGLYFSALRALILLTLLCGFISLYSIIYFASEEYDPVKFGYGLDHFAQIFVAGSALCLSADWVPCPDCNCRDPDEPYYQLGLLTPTRCAVATSSNGTQLLFALKNNCDGTRWELAASNYATVIFMILSMAVLGWFMRKEEIKFDEDEQTAQDYSIQITNPPSDANDPEEWRRFFKENCDGAQVTVCTCAVHNDLLVQTLVERREKVRLIKSLQPGESMDMLDIARKAAEIERDRNLIGRLLAGILPGIPEHFSRLIALRGKVEGLSQLEYPVTNVFITFETEQDQRRVLKNLSVGSVKARNNDSSALSDSKYLFRGKYVLAVSEPEEPSTIRWQDLNTGITKRMKQQIYTGIFTLLLLAAVGFLIFYINRVNVLWASYSISIVNVVFPFIATLMTDHAESHRSESQKQASLYFKIVLFRWVTGAAVFFFITAFEDTIGTKGVIRLIFNLFFSDLTLTNGLSVLDPAGHFQRHFLAPRAKTQEDMNLLFQGSKYELAERYTDMTKILFMCLFYCSIFPSAFFLCAISLSLKYLCDKFTLIRTWKRAPALGTVISKISRRYFFTIAVGVMAIVCSYYWAGFPFDNLCANEGSVVDPSYIGEFTLSEYPGSPYKTIYIENATVSVTEADIDYRYCNMDFLAVSPYVSFPFVPTLGNPLINPEEYMTDDQLMSTTYFGWSVVVILCLILLKYVVVWYKSFQNLYSSSYEAVGDVQNIPYSEVTSRSAYIPQVTSPSFAFPLIACKVDSIDEELFDFTDPDRSYKYYDLSMDAKRLLARHNITDPPGFSVVKSWPPEKEN